MFFWAASGWHRARVSSVGCHPRRPHLFDETLHYGCCNVFFFSSRKRGNSRYESAFGKQAECFFSTRKRFRFGARHASRHHGTRDQDRLSEAVPDNSHTQNAPRGERWSQEEGAPRTGRPVSANKEELDARRSLYGRRVGKSLCQLRGSRRIEGPRPKSRVLRLVKAEFDASAGNEVITHG